jgi:hypothetical protein
MGMMIILLACVLSALLPGQIQAGESHRDKTGTTWYGNLLLLPKTPEKPELAKAGSFQAERGGFEPPVTLRPHRFSRPTQSTTLAPLLRPTAESGRTEIILRILGNASKRSSLCYAACGYFACAKTSSKSAFISCQER